MTDTLSFWLWFLSGRRFLGLSICGNISTSLRMPCYRGILHLDSIAGHTFLAHRHNIAKGPKDRKDAGYESSQAAAS
jgi:hypothetical protein